MKFDVLARFRETIPTVKSVSSSDIQRINFRFLTEITILSFFQKLEFLGSYSSDRRFASGQEVKFFYATRATRGHRFGGVSTTTRGRGFLLLVLFFGQESCEWLGVF